MRILVLTSLNTTNVVGIYNKESQYVGIKIMPTITHTHLANLLLYNPQAIPNNVHAAKITSGRPKVNRIIIDEINV